MTINWDYLLLLCLIVAAVVLFEGACLFAAGKIGRLERVRYLKCVLAAFLAHAASTLALFLLALLASGAERAPDGFLAACLVHPVVLALVLQPRRLREVVAYGTGLAIYALIFVAIALPALSPARAEARRTMDMANLSQIRIALAYYGEDYEGQTPASLDELLAGGYAPSKEVFVSPGDPHPLPTPGGMPCSYEYVGAVRLDHVEDTTIICYTRNGILPGGRNVLFADSSLLWVAGDKLQNPRQDLKTDLESALRYSVKPKPAASMESGNAVDSEAWQKGREKELRRFYELAD